MKQVISTSFGISEIHIGSVTVYTGKIAFKSLFGIEINPLIRQRKTAKGRIELSFETPNKEVAEVFSQYLGNVCKTIALKKLETKYKWVKPI